jgi:hypothetical protein
MSIIRTRFRPATDHTGSRIRANIGVTAITLPYDHALSGSENHRRAAQALAEKRGLKGRWASVWDEGQETGNTFVNLDQCRADGGFDITG